MKITMKNLVRIFIGIVLVTRASADVTLPAIFSDHMVLQSGMSVPVWGWAEVGEEITVTIDGQTKSVITGADGKWMLKLDALKAGESLTMKVRGKNTVTVTDVLVGEVWLCSGQSNMAMFVNDAKDCEKEKAVASFPNIRMFRVTSGGALAPQDKCGGQWVVCSTNTVSSFSATAYFFGREIHQKTGRGIGLINSSVGGTPIESWTSVEAQQSQVELKPLFARWEKQQADWNPDKAKAKYETELTMWTEADAKAKIEGKPSPNRPWPPIEPRLSLHHPGNLFNGKIAPLIPYALRGAIWYQGEANAGGGANLYRRQLTTLITDWRSRWGVEFPFAWVQLPEFMRLQVVPVEESGWPLVREAMLQTLKLPQTGMAIALGTGEADNIHPKNKQEVGRRLALWALAAVYGKKDVVWAGPLLAGYKITGSEVVISFTHTDGGLMAKDGELKGFAITGDDKKWVWANAKIDGDTVIVSHPDVKAPAAVRYAWANNPATANLCNGAGLPASPFRTDAP